MSPRGVQQVLGGPGGQFLDGRDAVDLGEVVDLLARLVDCSLLVVTDGAGATGRLAQAAASADQRLYTALAQPHLRGHGQRQRLRRPDAENATCARRWRVRCGPGVVFGAGWCTPCS